MAELKGWHTPYHRVLDDACERAHRRFGAVWHVNCHSIPPSAIAPMSRRSTLRPSREAIRLFVLDAQRHSRSSSIIWS
jgi:N-formylglutamate amidohydrolase